MKKNVSALYRIGSIMLVFFALCLVMTGPTEAAEGPAAYWPMDEGMGNIITDKVSGLEGKINGAKWTEGISGSALKFDGVDDTANLGHSPLLAVSQGTHTIEMWVKVITFRASDTIWSKTKEWRQRIGVDIFRGKAVLSSRNMGVTECLNICGPISTGTWFHLATTIDTVNQSAKVYIDGKFQAEDTTFSLADTTTAFDFVLGSKGRVNHAFFNGVIDEVAIYDRILTETEIKQKYLKGEKNMNARKISK